MVEYDEQLPGVVFDKLPAFVDRGFLPALVGEGHMAHGDGRVSCNKHRSVFQLALSPALEGKACVFGKVAVPPTK